MVHELGSPRRDRAEGVALCRGNFGTDGTDKLESSLVALPEDCLVRLAGGVGEEIVSECSGLASVAPHQPDPRVQKESHQHHAERAPLGNAARAGMGMATPATVLRNMHCSWNAL